MSSAQAARLRGECAASRVRFNWWGAHKTLSASHKSEVAEIFSADTKSVSAGKKLFDTKNESYAALSRLKSEIVSYWVGITLPYVEDGVRLLRRSQVPTFDEKMTEFSREFNQRVSTLAENYADIKAEAERRLGRLFNAGDYPSDIAARFGMSWDFPNTEPPNYLLQLNPELYRQEQERVRARFEEAVRLGEQAFAEQLRELVAHMADRLTPGPDGQKKIFRDSAVENFKEFFQRFRSVGIGSNAELDAVVVSAEQLLGSNTAQDLRRSEQARSEIALGLQQVRQQLDRLVTNPRRRAFTIGGQQTSQATTEPGNTEPETVSPAA